MIIIQIRIIVAALSALAGIGALLYFTLAGSGALGAFSLVCGVMLSALVMPAELHAVRVDD